MSTPINLNKARKARAKADKAKHASENRVKFGQTKSARELEKANAAKAARLIDEKKLED